MKEYEQFPDSAACYGAPWLHGGIHSAARSLAKCDTMKRIEALGKCPAIDQFTQRGIPLGAHRAFDRLHDPFYGPYFAARDLGGVRNGLKLWVPHMASDVLTPMSLPLPGTFKAGVHSLRYQLYRRGLVNVRTVVLAPVLNVAVADLLVRADVFGRVAGRPRSAEERAAKLWETHAWNAALSAGLAVVAFVGPSAPAVAVAYAGTAAWSALTAGGYYAVAHRAEISAAVRSAAGKAATAAKTTLVTGRTLLEQSKAPPPPAPKVGPVRLGLAAALLTVALACGRP